MMKLSEALAQSEMGMAEAAVNGLVYTVKNDQADFSPTDPYGDPVYPYEFALFVAEGAMPPQVTLPYGSTDEIERDYPELDWQPTEGEEN